LGARNEIRQLPDFDVGRDGYRAMEVAAVDVPQVDLTEWTQP
jgi:hypothetical protein